MPILEVKKLQISFENKIIFNNLSFVVNSGDYLHIVGKNGAGKTSLIRSILGILPITHGEIFLENKKIQTYNPNELAKVVAYLPQIANPAPFSVIELLELSSYAHKESKDFLTSPFAQKIIQSTQIEELLARQLYTLSGGERQRAYLASALLQKPKLLILDEVSNFLDAWHNKALLEMLDKFNSEDKLSIISVSHNLEEVGNTGKALLILDEEDTQYYAEAKPEYLNTWVEKNSQKSPELTFIPKNNLALKFILLAIFTILSIGAGLFLGLNDNLQLEFMSPFISQAESSIFLNIRLARTLTAFMVGAGLSLTGMAFQALFRNPLASPFTLGISSGAAFGAALSIILPITFINIMPTFSALIFSFLVMYLVWRLSRSTFYLNNTGLLLAGVAANFFFSSLLMLVQYLSNLGANYKITRMLMGSLDSLGLDYALILSLVIILSTLPFLLMSKELDLLLLGEDEAQAKGADLGRIRLIIFVFSGILVAFVVAFCGPIGFVGMIIPHICRIVFGQRHKILAPSSAILGGVFLLSSDIFAKFVIAPAEIPVGVVTSVIGAPVFFYLLSKKPSR